MRKRLLNELRLNPIIVAVIIIIIIAVVVTVIDVIGVIAVFTLIVCIGTLFMARRDLVLAQRSQ